ncbi:hypothetical protein GCM10027456_06120 [Kineosporia babensis]
MLSPRIRSFTSASELSISTGSASVAGSVRSSRSTSTPLPSGRFTSSTTQSTVSAASCSQAAATVAHSTVRHPASSKARFRSIRTVRLSSRISTVPMLSG